MLVRLGQESDLDEIAGMLAALWPEGTVGEHREEARAILAGQPPSTLPLVLLVAEDRNRLIGLVEVGLRSHADGCDERQPVGFIEGWYVLDEHRRAGVGRKLIEAAAAWAREQGARELASDALIDNEVSMRAHEALGFVVVDRCVHYRKPIAETLRSSSALYYGADLARIHHEYFGNVARAAARELLARLAAAGFDSGTVVDLAAGSGILSRAVLEAGFAVVAVDLSEDMLRIARSEAPEATFVHESLWSAALPPCVAVTAIGEAFSYAADARAGMDALVDRLASVHRALVPGGIFVFDIASAGRSGPTGSRRAFHPCGDAALGVDEVERDGEVTRVITFHVPQGSLYRRVNETHRLRLYEPAAVERALSEAGFAWERLAGYGGLTFPGWHAYAARR